MTLYVATWEERDPMPGRAAAAGRWRPMPFEEARKILADTLERNLDRWAGHSDNPHVRERYEEALASLRTTRPALWSRVLPYHILGITIDQVSANAALRRTYA